MGKGCFYKIIFSVSVLQRISICFFFLILLTKSKCKNGDGTICFV